VLVSTLNEGFVDAATLASRLDCMRILAIGDIHGCSIAFDTLLQAVEPRPEDLLVTLGDYVDRGPDSRGVLERLLQWKQTHRLVALAGNHEQMILEARQDPEVYAGWLTVGGDMTLISYGREGQPGTLSDVPAEHWTFLEDCRDWLETERFVFVHANLEPNLPLEQQPLSALRWQKFADPLPHVSGKTMICGHTRQISGLPRNLGYAVCIDTWVYGAGWLTCLEPVTGHVWQANQLGQRRELWLADLREGDGEGSSGVVE
jgi:serine/threonine protein phosphatase 1